MKNIAIVTGCYSGIGRCITLMLLDMGYIVYGFSRHSDVNIKNDDFFNVNCDITNTEKLTKNIKQIINIGNDVSILVNNAGIGYFGQHEDIKVDKIKEMVDTNLTAPMILTKLLLKPLKKSKGTIINISSACTLKPAVFGCAYSATKSGIHQFSISLFDEVRKTGVRVINITPDMTKTKFYENTYFDVSDDCSEYIEPSDIADIVKHIINNKNTVITDIVIQPQRHGLKKKKNEG